MLRSSKRLRHVEHDETFEARLGDVFQTSCFTLTRKNICASPPSDGAWTEVGEQTRVLSTGQSSDATSFTVSGRAPLGAF